MDLINKIWEARQNKDYDLVCKLERQKKEDVLNKAISNLNSQDIDIFTNLIDNYAHMTRWVKDLQEANKELKTENYKDKQLAEMKERLDKADADLRRGFSISEKEDKAINDWLSEHRKVCSPAPGCIGGNYTYEFIPTSIGTVGTIKCSCGEQFTFQDL